MAKKVTTLGQVAEGRIQRFGERLRMARLRRRLTAKHLAELAGMTAVTLRNLERGNAGVTIGAYLAVMQVLGMDGDLDLLLKDDPLGREVQDANLPKRGRGKDSSHPVAAESHLQAMGRGGKDERSRPPAGKAIK
ncbi:helix-turn-helix domain-containing protein [Bordetella sp. BOR01]|uniref:helix-turn-helix domain-containing protein n=1 Tax=Bordetella sp. BOR01 TaxID=2854779 RepID=UPI001C485CD5|nr:helix-turn-helix domain-containing protein [Bordetella sp. BOR01]MBV7482597.1 helix-turn-helix domain-containing protein [Bordetella sp. BOR01]